MTISPSIFKAYDVRALYPSELNESTARLIGRAFVAYLQPARIAVTRDMRVSSPSLTEAFISGALEQGTDVYDYVANAFPDPAAYDMGAHVISQLWGVGVTLLWSGIVSLVAFKLVDLTIGLRVNEEQEREGLDTVSHGERAYNG